MYRTQPRRTDYQVAGGLRWQGRPRLLHLSEGQANDHKTAAAVIEDLPAAKALLADRAYSSAAFRQALVERGITPCIPPHAKHRVQHSYDPVLYRQRHRIENMFARLKDWRRVHTRYDRCAHTFLSAIAFAAAFIFWINESSGNLWLLPSELKDGSHFWLSKAEGRKQP
jgi:transposase